MVVLLCMDVGFEVGATKTFFQDHRHFGRSERSPTVFVVQVEHEHICVKKEIAMMSACSTE